MDITIALVKAATVFAVGARTLWWVMKKTDQELLPSGIAALFTTGIAIWIVQLI